jgi:hypothetical protein
VVIQRLSQELGSALVPLPVDGRNVGVKCRVIRGFLASHWLSPGACHDYKRNGTTTLVAALEVATGTVTDRCYERHGNAVAAECSD